MLDRYFRRRHVVARLRAGPFGQHLEEFATYLHDRGHASITVRLYVWGAEEFVRWIAQVDERPDDHYRIRFLSDPAAQWQSRSLQALRAFAPNLVTVEIAS